MGREDPSQKRCLEQAKYSVSRDLAATRYLRVVEIDGPSALLCCSTLSANASGGLSDVTMPVPENIGRQLVDELIAKYGEGVGFQSKFGVVVRGSALELFQVIADRVPALAIAKAPLSQHPEPMTGKLTVSIDLELAWGVWDTITPEKLRLAEEAERPIAAALIALFDRHAIPATWAMVAALLDEKSAHTRPGPKSCWFAPDVVEQLVAAKTRHEIGTHSGRHVYFDRIGASEAEDDLGFARTIHRENGLSFTSMVFPRNVVGHLKQLAGVGLRTFRGPDAGPATAIRRVSESLGQAANLAGKALPLPPPVVAAKRSGGMIDVPGSMLLMARNGVRRLVLASVTRAKLKSGLERARASGGIFHLWFHPSNFYFRREEQLATLDWFLGHAANEAGQGRIEISTMSSYADRKASDQGADAKP